MVKQEIYGVGKKDTIKPRRGYKSKTVIVNVMCSIEPEGGDASTLWGAVMNWKEGKIKHKHYVSSMLSELVILVVGRVKERLREMDGVVQKVDVIFNMPSGKDHRMTVTYLGAMRSKE